ncbi:MAG: DHH family phosphoesterase [Ardenticatenaceae bacterium]
MSNPLLDEIIARLKRAQRILIFSHVKPDGDAFGSALGLMWLLRTQDHSKTVEVSFADPVSVGFRFLPGHEEVDNRPVDGHDLVVALDGSDSNRYGDHFSDLLKAKQTAGAKAEEQQQEHLPFMIGIDHHKTNTGFADLNWVDAGYVATAQMIYHLAHYADWSITPEAATCLATGCVTDTNAFSTDHTTPQVLENVASLMRQGASLSTIIHHSMKRTAADVALWGRILSTLQIENGVAWAVSRIADRAALKANVGDGGGISNFLQNIIGVHIGILFVEIHERKTRISMRCAKQYDVSQLAASLEGGGHKQAAGATLKMRLDKAIPLVIEGAKAIQPI